MVSVILLLVSREDDARLATDGVLDAAHEQAFVKLTIALLQVALVLLGNKLAELAFPHDGQGTVDDLLGAVVQVQGDGAASVGAGEGLNPAIGALDGGAERPVAVLGADVGGGEAVVLHDDEA